MFKKLSDKRKPLKSQNISGSELSDIDGSVKSYSTSINSAFSLSRISNQDEPSDAEKVARLRFKTFDKNTPSIIQTESTRRILAGPDYVELPPVSNNPSLNISIDDHEDLTSISSIMNSNLSREELVIKYTKVTNIAKKFKAKIKEMIDYQNSIENERDSVRDLLKTQQERSFRRIQELNEQIQLDQQAKRDLAETFLVNLQEKDENIKLLTLKIDLLKEGKPLTEDMTKKMQESEANESLKRDSYLEDNINLKKMIDELQASLSKLKSENERLVNERELNETQKSSEIQQLNSKLEAQTVLKKEIQKKLNDLQYICDENEKIKLDLQTRLRELSLQKSLPVLKNEDEELREKNQELLKKIESNFNKHLEEVNQYKTIIHERDELILSLEDRIKEFSSNDQVTHEMMNEVGNLQRRIEKSDEHIKTISESLEKSQIVQQDYAKKCDSLKQNLQALNDQITQLEKEKSDLIEKNSTSKSSAEKTIEEMREKFNGLQQEKDLLAIELQEWKKKSTPSVEKEANSKETEMNEVIGDLERRCKELEASKLDLSNEIQTLNNSLDQANTCLKSEVEARIKASHELSDFKKSTETEKHEEKKNLVKRITELETKLAEVSAEKDWLNSLQIDELEKSQKLSTDSLKAATDAKSKAEEELSDKQKSLESFMKENERISQQQKELEQKYAELKTERDDLAAKINKLTEDIKSSEATLADVLKKNEEIETTKKSHEIELDNLKNTIKEIQIEKGEIEMKAKELTKTLEEKEKAIIDLTSQNEVLKSDEESSSKKTREVRERLKEVLQDQEISKKNLLAKFETDKGALVAKIDETSSRLEEALRKITQLEASRQATLTEASSLSKMQFESDMAIVKSEHLTEIENLHNNHKKTISEMKKKHEEMLANKIAQMKTSFEDSLKRVQNDESQAIKNLNENLRDSRRALEEKAHDYEELEKKINLQAIEYNECMAKVKSLEEELQKMNEKVTENIERVETPIEAEIVSCQNATATESAVEQRSNSLSDNLMDVLQNTGLYRSIMKRLFSIRDEIQKHISPDNLEEDEVDKKDWALKIHQSLEELMNDILTERMSIASSNPERGNTVSIHDYEILKLHNSDIQNQLYRLSKDFENLSKTCHNCLNKNNSLDVPIESPLNNNRFNSFSSPRMEQQLSIQSKMSIASIDEGSLKGFFPGLHIHEAMEYEYLRNILFEYMIGHQTGILSRVISTIMRFTAQQIKSIQVYEDNRGKKRKVLLRNY